ncbi:MAG TPA: DUF1638 domain-containing protein [Desulfobacteria bacterium]|nr:DUF1638 domain-containing protein [Desulfobacteria bacterium]
MLNEVGDMMLNIISCGMIMKEVEFVLTEIGLSDEVAFLDHGVHNFERLETNLTEQINKKKEANNKPTIVIIGQACHPEMTSLLDQHSIVGLHAANCFEALLGSEKELLDKESNTFYMTSGWFDHWEEIFESSGWTEVDARLNMGFGDRVLLLDTGLIEITDEKILKLFDIIQVPIEIKQVNLDHLKKLIVEAVERAKITRADA